LAQYEEFFHTTMPLLKSLKAGEVNLDQVAVSDNGWEIKPAVESNVHQEA